MPPTIACGDMSREFYVDRFYGLDAAAQSPLSVVRGDMARSNRWSYMAQLHYNPPSDDCPDCTVPSKIYFIGAKRIVEDGVLCKVTRYRCEHHHEWYTKVSYATPEAPR